MRKASGLAALVALHLAAAGCAVGTSYTARVREDCTPARTLPEGGKPPREARPGCFAENLIIPRELIAHGAARVIARWAVCADGAVGSLHVPAFFGTAEAKERLQVAVWRAVQSCEWRPGSDATGRLVDMWMDAPIELRP